MSDLPPGFVLDKPAPSGGAPSLPAGFVLDKPSPATPSPAQPEQSIAERLWEGLQRGWGEGRVAGDPLKTAAAVPSRMLYGMAEGLGAAGKVIGGVDPFSEVPPDQRTMTRGEMIGGAQTLAGLAAGQGFRPGRAMTATGETGKSMAAVWDDLLKGTPGAARDTGSGPTTPTPPAAPVAQPAGPLVQGANAPGAWRPAIAQPTGKSTLRIAEPEAGESTAAPEQTGLAKAITDNDGMAVDQKLARTFRRAVPMAKPTGGGLSGARAMNAQDRQIVSAIDTIIENRPNLRIPNEPPGQMPRSRRDLSEAIAQTKDQVFKAYDQAARQAGEEGVVVDLAPAANLAHEMAASPALRDASPAGASQLEQMALNLDARGRYSPLEAQNYVQILNRIVGDPQQPGTIKGMIAQVRGRVLDQLDQAIESSGRPQYLALRNRYRALRSIEDSVSNAVRKEANGIPGFANTFTDYLSAEEIIRGIVTLNPAAIARGAAMKGAQKLVRSWNDPNRAVIRMFAHRQAQTMPIGPGMPRQAPRLRQPYDPLAGVGGGAFGGELDRNRAPERTIQRYIQPQQ